MTSVRALVVLLSTATSVSACGRVVLDDRASEGDDGSASGDASGTGDATSNGAGTGGGTGTGGGGAGGGDGLGGAPLLDWPEGPDGEPPAESACWIDLSLTFSSSLPTPDTLALVPHDDDHVRMVATGSVGASGGSPGSAAIETYDDVLSWNEAMLVGSTAVEGAASPAVDGRVPFATRGDVTVHVHAGDTTALAVRTMALNDVLDRLVTVSTEVHPVPGAPSPIRALALPGDRTVLLAHGPAESPGLSTVSLPDDPSAAAVVTPLTSLRPCADRPVAFTAAPGAERTAIAFATDGTTCTGAAGAPDVVHTAILDAAGAVLSESRVRVEGPVEALWSTAGSDGRWVALRLAGGTDLLIGRIGDDAAIEPIATIPGGADPSFASWNDGLAVVDVVEEELRVRLVDGSGAVVEQALQPFLHSRGRASILAAPAGLARHERAAELIVGTFVPEGGENRVRLKWFDCDL